MQPFHSKANDPGKEVHMSDLSRDWNKLNYTYYDLDAAASKALGKDGRLNEERYKAALLKIMNALYPSSATIIRSVRKKLLDGAPGSLVRLHWNLHSSKDGEWQDYIINVIYDRHALQGTAYSIEFYLGTSETHEKITAHPGNLVGQVFTFSNSQGDLCLDCKTEEATGILSRGQVPLTLHLLHHLADSVADHSLDSFADAEVESYLGKHLHWRFVRLGGDLIPASMFPQTRIKVLRGKGQLKKAYGVSLEGGAAYFPAYDTATYAHLPNTTANKPWGLRHGEGSNEFYGSAFQ